MNQKVYIFFDKKTFFIK